MSRLTKTILLSTLVVLIGVGLFYFPYTTGRQDVSLLQWRNATYRNRNKVNKAPVKQIPPSEITTPDGGNVVVIPPQTTINQPGTTTETTPPVTSVPQQPNVPNDGTQIPAQTPAQAPSQPEQTPAQTPAQTPVQTPAAPPSNTTSTTGSNHPFTGGRGAALPQKYSTAYIGTLDQEIFKLVNEARKQNGLNQLQWDATIYDMSKYKSTSMLQLEYFAHENPNYGNEGPSAIAKAFGYSYRGLGENILYVQGTPLNNVTAKYLFDMWMNSPGHRANILHPDFTKIGVSVVYCDSYKSSVILYATQQFAN